MSTQSMWVVAAIVVIIVGVRYAPQLIIPAVGLIALYIVLQLGTLHKPPFGGSSSASP